MNKILIPYNKAEQHIINGDLLLFRTRGVYDFFIRHITGSEYTHIGVADRYLYDGTSDPDDAALFCLEVRPSSGQANLLQHYAQAYPGQIDVYRLSPEFVEVVWDAKLKLPWFTSRTCHYNWVAHNMYRFMGCTYGFWSVFRTFLTYCPIIRLFLSHPTDDELYEGTRRPDCSQAVSFAVRRAFTDLVDNKPDMFTIPGDFATSPLCHYLFTITAPE